MGLSARTDDNTGKPLGEGYVTLATSAANALLFRDLSSANAYRLANPGQFSQSGNNAGGYNTETALGQA